MTAPRSDGTVQRRLSTTGPGNTVIVTLEGWSEITQVRGASLFSGYQDEQRSIRDDERSCQTTLKLGSSCPNEVSVTALVEKGLDSRRTPIVWRDQNPDAAEEMSEVDWAKQLKYCQAAFVYEPPGSQTSRTDTAHTLSSDKAHLTETTAKAAVLHFTDGGRLSLNRSDDPMDGWTEMEFLDLRDRVRELGDQDGVYLARPGDLEGHELAISIYRDFVTNTESDCMIGNTIVPFMYAPSQRMIDAAERARSDVVASAPAHSMTKAEEQAHLKEILAGLKQSGRSSGSTVQVNRHSS